MDNRNNMAAVIGKIDIASLSRSQSLSDEVVVGKDVLELLAGAMYADPLTIFREYIQNAADSIDVAKAKHLDPGMGFGVTIALDRANRSIVIRDNGASIGSKDFASRLTSIGASHKRGKSLRGFRGVGRLSGLGYCQELVFRGRAEGDQKITELRWNGRKLRDLLRDANYEGGLTDLVRSAVEMRKLPGDGAPSRFFEVELYKVTRLRGDLLMSEDSIRSYLSQVAPVPFHPNFEFGEQIATFLKDHGVREPIDVRLQGDESPIYHGADNVIEFNERIKDQVHSVEFLEFLGQDGDVEAFGWVLEHAYLGAIPRKLGLGGIRLRTGNIQVGGEAVLSHLFAEPRFASWAIGDIHVESASVLPNARRDEFEATVAYAHLQDEFTIFLKRIAQGIRDRSLQRNRIRKSHQLLELAEKWLDEARDQALPSAVQHRVRAIVEARVDEAQHQLEKMGEESPEVSQVRQRIRTTLARRTKLLREDDAAGKRRSARDKAIDVALGVILEHSASPSVGLSMSKKILSAFEES